MCNGDEVGSSNSLKKCVIETREEPTITSSCDFPGWKYDYFPSGQLLNDGMKLQLRTWLYETGRMDDNGRWELCYSSPNGDPKENAREFHKRCDKYDKTLFVVSQNGNTFGGYTEDSWGNPASNGGPQGWRTEYKRQFLFRLNGEPQMWEPNSTTSSDFHYRLPT